MSVTAPPHQTFGTAILRNKPLVIDLDGTLIASDLLYEALAKMLRQAPWLLLLLPFWLLRGKAFLKEQVAARIEIDPSRLPYREDVLALIRTARQEGRATILATASHRRWADAVAGHLQCFDEVLATDAASNLRGPRKAEAIVTALGNVPFDYVGDHRVDYPIWARSDGGVVVASSRSFVSNTLEQFPQLKELFITPSPALMTWSRALRCHQWVKNLLLFVPLLMAHQIMQLHALTEVALAFVAFSLCASSVYLWNDMADLDADRAHHRKCERPLASGALPLRHAFMAAPLLLLSAFALSSFVNPSFQLVLAGYLFATSMYTVWLKRLVLVDILMLAGLYTLRILAGGIAAQITVSHWLLVFSLFFFLSLAAVKRFSELYLLRRNNMEGSAGRGYRADDLEQVAVFGASSGYISVLVLALYVSSDEVRALYAHPQLVWLVCPLLLYWVSRVWLLAHRGVLHDDPIVFAITDRVSYAIGAIVAAILLVAA